MVGESGFDLVGVIYVLVVEVVNGYCWVMVVCLSGCGYSVN